MTQSSAIAVAARAKGAAVNSPVAAAVDLGLASVTGAVSILGTEMTLSLALVLAALVLTNDRYGGNGGVGTGISNTGQLDTGDGNDAITGIGIGGISGGGISGGNGGVGTGISNRGSLNTGGGNDTITGTGTGGISGGGLFGGDGSVGTGIGIQNIKGATITTGQGNDTITGSGNALAYSPIVIGISNDGVIDTGNGGDILTGQATATIGGAAYGIYGKGTIKTGDGDDKITSTSTIDGVQQKVTIGGGMNIDLGTGNDYFKGFGTGTVDGGKGFDTLDLSAFNRSELTFSGVISGNALNPANISFNNNKNVITLSTTGFENFIFADGSLYYSTLV